LGENVVEKTDLEKALDAVRKMSTQQSSEKNKRRKDEVLTPKRNIADEKRDRQNRLWAQKVLLWF